MADSVAPSAVSSRLCNALVPMSPVCHEADRGQLWNLGLSSSMERLASEPRRCSASDGGASRGPFLVLCRDPPSEPPVVKGVTGRFIDITEQYSPLRAPRRCRLTPISRASG